MVCKTNETKKSEIFSPFGIWREQTVYLLRELIVTKAVEKLLRNLKMDFPISAFLESDCGDCKLNMS